MSQDSRGGRPAEDPRVRFAAERTLLAWIRTGLALMGFGFVVARFGLFLREVAAARQGASPARSPGASLVIGTGLVALGVLVTVLAAREHARVVREIERGGAYTAPRWSLGMAVAWALAAVGAGMVVYLVAVSP
jgi:putative membrane protein